MKNQYFSKFFLTLKTTAMKKTKNRFLMLLFILVMSNMMLLAQVKRTVTGDVKDNKGLPV